MSTSRRRFLKGLAAAGGAAAVSPLIKVRRAFGNHAYNTHKVVIVGIGGGLRTREALGMAEGATMPNLFGRIPLIPGFGQVDAGDPIIAPEFDANFPALVLPTVRPAPLYTEGTLITNIRYAEGAPGHLQGQGCLVSGYYNNIENRGDARLPVPTVFELHRRATNTAATDAWYISNVGGFYSALQTSEHPEYGAAFGGKFLSPPSVMNAIVPIVASGVRDLNVGVGSLPTIPNNVAEREAVSKLTGILNGNSPEFEAQHDLFRSTPAENADMEAHFAEIFGDDTYQAFYPDSIGIGLSNGNGGIDSTGDALTVYHAERILERFQPSVTALTLIDVDTCHGDFNSYLKFQQVADALVTHLWNFIQSTPGLMNETTMIVLPEHGRHLFMNGQNPDSFGRSGVDHGQGDDGDRDVWALMLGPDIAANNVIAPTGITQSGRTSGRYESIDAIMTAMELMGHAGDMESAIMSQSARPGIVIAEALS